MATEKKTENAALVLNDEQMKLLQSIVKATETPPHFTFAPLTEDLKALVKAGLAEAHEATKNEEGHIAARATEEGKKFMPPVTAEAVSEPVVSATVAAVAANMPPVNGFAIVDTVPLPEAKRGGRGKATVYPFDKLEPGQSFFMPNVIENGKEIEAATKYASTVSSATARFAVKDPEGKTRIKKTLVKDADGKAVLDDDGKKQYNEETVPLTIPTREFIIRQVADGEPWGKPGVKGAGVWRRK